MFIYCVFVYVFIYLFIDLFIYLFVYFVIYLSIYLFMYLFIHSFIHSFIYLFICHYRLLLFLSWLALFIVIIVIIIIITNTPPIFLSLLLNSLNDNFLTVLLITSLLLLLLCFLPFLSICYNTFCITLFLFDLIYYLFLHCFTIIITFYFGYLFYITYVSKVRAACIVVPYNNGFEAPIGLSGENGFVYRLLSWDVWAGHGSKEEAFSPVESSLHSGIRLVSENMVIVAIDMYVKSPLWQWIYRTTWLHMILTL